MTDRGCPVCGKRCFTSRHKASREHRYLGHKIRVYFSRECRCWHVAGNWKR